MYMRFVYTSNYADYSFHACFYAEKTVKRASKSQRKELSEYLNVYNLY